MTAEPQHFAPDPAKLGAVRALVCEEAGVDISHPAVLVANELASNAITHTRRLFAVRVCSNRVIRIEVVDTEPGLRAGLPTSPKRLGGHGLKIVEELSEQWGTIVDSNEKIVWAEVAS